MVSNSLKRRIKAQQKNRRQDKQKQKKLLLKACELEGIKREKHNKKQWWENES